MKPRIAAVSVAVLLSACAAPRQGQYIADRDMFSVNPVAGSYAGYEDYLARQYYAMGGNVPSDLSAAYGRCLDQAYLGLLTPAELARLDAAATRTGSPMAGAEKAAFEQQFMARVSRAKMESTVRAACPDTVGQVERALGS